MSNQIDITIKAPAPPEGYELYTGEGRPPLPYYRLSTLNGWELCERHHMGGFVYAIPIATPEEALIEAVRVYVQRFGGPAGFKLSKEYLALLHAFKVWQKMAVELW
jgi:hypothetical protein